MHLKIEKCYYTVLVHKLDTIMSAVVSNIVVTDLSPKVKNPAIQKYLPSGYFPKHIEFNIKGVSNAVSNGLRRTIGGELLVKALFAEFENLTTTDVFIIPEMVLKRLRMIPLDQSTPLNATFEIDATNDTPNVRDVKSSEIKIIGGMKKLPFNETFTLFTLQPGRACNIKPIGIHQAYGFTEGDGMHCVACNTVSICTDQTPINMYTGEGISSSVANPREWKIAFNTNGTMAPKDIVKSACDNIIARVMSVQELLYSIENKNDEYSLTIEGESDTLGNLFMRTISDLYPDIRAVTYSGVNVGRTLTIRVRCDEDINTIFTTAIKQIVKTYGDIKKYFE